MLTKGVISLAECYVKTERVDEAMDLHKILCDEIGKESLNPDDILLFAEILQYCITASIHVHLKS